VVSFCGLDVQVITPFTHPTFNQLQIKDFRIPMANLQGFDANSVEPADELEPIPAGRYVAVIVDSEMKPTKSGTGNYLQLTFQIVEGEHANRLLWVRLNLDNPNATAVEIARRELSAICRSVGVLVPTDSTDLHNLPCVIHVRVKRRNDTGELQNEIKGYSKRESAASKPIETSVGPGTVAPWKR
jgi:hypothetical protein